MYDSDEPPTDITSSVSGITVAENEGVTALATFTAVDPDQGQTHVFSIPVGDQTTFSMTSGGDLATKIPLNREAIPGGTIELDVTASGQQYTSDPTYGLNVPGTESATKRFTITVTDVNEAPDYSAST